MKQFLVGLSLFALVGCQTVTYNPTTLYECKSKAEDDCDRDGKWYPIANSLEPSSCMSALLELRKAEKDKLFVCRAFYKLNSKGHSSLPWM